MNPPTRFVLAILLALVPGCSSTPARDATTGGLDATVSDARTACESLCAPVTLRCTGVTVDVCLAACDTRATFRDGGPDAMFHPRDCLTAAELSCEGIVTCLGGPALTAWSPGPYGLGARDLAGPVTLATTGGDWSLRDHWTGEDSYVFLTHAPGALVDSSGADYLAGVFSASILDVIDRSPPNVHYFFMPYRTVTPDFEAFRAGALADLDTLTAEQQAHWRPRLHFVTTPVTTMTSWIAERARALIAARYGLPYDVFTFAIDRFQRLREVGQLGILVGSGSVLGDMSYAGFEPLYYNFEWDRERQLARENATVIPVVQSATVTREIVATASLPDAATMATFDAMEFDLTLSCADHVDGHCGPWDYLSNLSLCEPLPTPEDAGTPDASADGSAPSLVCNSELARWITSYWREGRWVTDASELLPLFRAGGARQLRWYASEQWTTHTDYHVDLSIRLFHRGAATQPTDAILVYQGNSFHPTDASQFAPFTFTVPTGVRSVKLYALITGHGADGALHCAEFCNHTHHFQVNSAPEHVLSFPEAGNRDGCAQRVGVGTVPNQHGTWYLGRGGWCPGSDVRPWVVDVTGDVQLGGTNTLTYRPLIANRPPGAGSGNSVVTVWLAYGR